MTVAADIAPARSRSGAAPALAIAGVLLAVLGSLILPAAPFSIDEALYIDMANAMAQRGAFDITPPDWPADAPMLAKSVDLVRIVDGRATPQYPALYGVIAAPFFLAFGVKGLSLLNALSALFCLVLTHRIARRAGADPWTARASVFLLGAASIFAGYVFAIWPHMLALAFLLAGAAATQRAAAGDGRWAALAGLAFSLGVGVRVDVVLAAVSAFFWLRIFAAPERRGLALALLAGMAPGLFILALMNLAKFDAFNPFTYGATRGGAALSRYAAIAGAVVAAAAAALAVNVAAPAPKRLLERAGAWPPAIWAVGVAGAVVALHLLFPRLYHGLALLLVDIQAYAGPPQPGLEQTASGFWDFWGVPKKALFQSMPWAVLALPAAIGLARGAHVRERSFCLLFAAAPIAFFAMSAWHGGMAYNMRYLLPAAPFIAILAATELARLRPAFARSPDLALRSAAAGVLLAFGAYALSPAYGEALAIPMRLYPQLALAGLLAASLLAVLPRRTPRRLAVAGALSVAAVADAAMISTFDAYGYAADRARNAAIARAYAEMLPPDALALSDYDELLAFAAIRGVAVVRTTPETRDAIDASIAAFVADRRCVYAHTARAAAMLGAARFEQMAMPDAVPQPGLALFRYRNNPPACPR